MNDVIEATAFQNGTLTKDQIATYLRKDIQGCIVTISEILDSPTCMEALVNVFYARYESMKPEGKEVPNDVG